MISPRELTQRVPSRVWLVIFLALGVYLWQRTTIPSWIGDVFPNQLAAYFLKTGQPEWIYTSGEDYHAWMNHSLPIARSLGLDCDLCTYMYPPFVAGMLMPFADVHPTRWRDAMFVLNTLLLFGFMFVIVRLCWNRMTVENALWVLVLTLLCYSLARATLLSQPVPLLAVLTWLALLWLRDGRDWPGGILLGLMTAIKLFPGVLLLLFVLDRRWRPVWIAAGTVIAVYAVSLLTLGLPLHAHWWETMREFSSRVIPYWGNQSPIGWLARAVFEQNIMEGRPVSFPGLLALRVIFAIVFGGGTLAALWKHHGSLTGEYLAPAAGLILGGVLLIVPTSWEHYWLFVLPVLGWSLSVEWKRGLSWPEAIWLGGAAFFFLMKLTRFYGDSDLGRVMTGSQTVGMIIFWLWLARRALQKPLPKTAVVVELS